MTNNDPLKNRMCEGAKSGIPEASEKYCDPAGKPGNGKRGRRSRSAATILGELVAAIKSLEDSREMELGFIEACGADDAYMSEKDKREYKFIKDTVMVDENNVRRLIREAKFCCK